MALDPKEFRQALGSFATGVCVIGAIDANGTPFGMTINSFASVSLDPALVLWSLQLNSDCYPAFEKADTFSINVLSAKQQDISNRYAKKNEHDLLAEDFYIGSTGTPNLHNVLTTFECKLIHRYPGGDHDILVGEVIELVRNSDDSPLIFHSGKYAKLDDTAAG